MKFFRFIKKVITLTIAAAVIYSPFGIANSRYETYTEKLSMLESVDGSSIEELEAVFVEISDARNEAAKLKMFLPEEKRQHLGGEDNFGIAEEITKAITDILPETEFLNIFSR